MDKKTEQIIAEQILRLPQELNIFATSPDWQRVIDEISVMYALTKEEASSIKFEVLLTLIGVADPDTFLEELTKILPTQTEAVDIIVAEVEEKIFAQVRPALLGFFESEQAMAAEAAPRGDYSSEAPIDVQIPKQSILPEKTSNPAPETPFIEKDLEYSFPKLIPKVPQPTIQPKTNSPQPSLMHPFEEKMKRAFTGSIPTNDEPSLESTPTLQTSDYKLAPSAPASEILTDQIVGNDPLNNPAPSKILPETPQTSDYKLAPSAPPQTPLIPLTGNLRHDVYREAIE